MNNDRVSVKKRAKRCARRAKRHCIDAGLRMSRLNVLYDVLYVYVFVLVVYVFLRWQVLRKNDFFFVVVAAPLLKYIMNP